MAQPKEMSESDRRRQERIQKELSGEPTLLGEPLSDIELKLLELTLGGIKGQGLYLAMELSKASIEYHRCNIRDKLGASSMREALSMYIQTQQPPTGTPNAK